MKESREMLRLRFHAETDIDVEPIPADWERYAKWLEALVINELNKGMLRENEMLRKRMREAMSVLEQGIAGRETARIQHNLSRRSIKTRLKKGAKTK
jgi:hypothetical protein